MDNNQTFAPTSTPTMTTEQMLQEILENTKKTKRYIAWQFYITVALVVLPLLAMVVMLPLVLNGMSALTGAGALQGLQ